MFLASTTVIVTLVLACGSAPDGPAAAASWVGTITTEGNVTTVVNESGSLWGGRGTLVEELAIGVEAGPDEYMFGFLNSIFANGERVVVLDEQADTVRVYGRSGEFLFGVGGNGQGPGEFTRPMIVTMDDEGRTFVYDRGARRLSEFAPSGQFVTSWQVADFGCCAWQMYPQRNGLLWIPVEEFVRTTRQRRFGARLESSEGPAGRAVWVPDIPFEPSFLEVDGSRLTTPFSARIVWSPTPNGGMVAGANDRYAFEIMRPDGRKIVVHHHGEPAAVDREEWEWNRRVRVARTRERIEGFDWDGAGMPHRKPAYVSLIGAISGEIWVGKEIGSVRVPDCTEDPLEELDGMTAIRPCFRSIFSIDVFDADGRYLGGVETPPDMRPYGLYINGRTIVAGFTEDELGVVRVKRYKLVLPGDTAS